MTTDTAGDPREDLRRLARGGATNLVGAGLAAVATFAFFVVAARRLSPADVGALAVAIGVFTIATTVAQLGANTGLTRGVAQALARRDPAQLPTLLRVGLVPSVIASVAVAVGVWVTADASASLLDPGAGRRTVLAVRAIAPWIPLGTLTLLLVGVSQGFGTMTPAVLADKIGRSWTQLATLVALGGAGAAAAATAYAWPSLLATIALAFWVRALVRAQVFEPAVGRPDGLARTFWRFSAPRGAAAACQTSMLWADTLLLAALASPAAAGTYALATRFLVVGHLFTGAVIQALGPRLASLFATDELDRARRTYRVATRAIVAVVWPVYLVVATFAPALLGIFGPQYVAAERTLVILALALLVAAACGPVDVVLLMGGRSSWSLVSWAGSLALMVGLDLLLIPRLGIDGAAIAWATAIVARNVGPLLLIHRALGIHPFGDGFARITLSAAGIIGLGGLGMRAWWGPGWVGLGLTVGVFGAVYLGVLWQQRGALVTGDGDRSEREVLA